MYHITRNTYQDNQYRRKPQTDRCQVAAKMRQIAAKMRQIAAKIRSQNRSCFRVLQQKRNVGCLRVYWTERRTQKSESVEVMDVSFLLVFEPNISVGVGN